MSAKHKHKLHTAEEYLAGHTIDYSDEAKGGASLLDPQDFLPNLYRALKSDLFYVFIVPNTDRFIRLMMYIEKKYYTPGTVKNREYALPIRFEPTNIYILGKKYLPRADLYDLIVTRQEGESLLGPVTKEEFLTSGVDFIVLSDGNKFNDAAVILEVTKFREYYNTQEMK